MRATPTVTVYNETGGTGNFGNPNVSANQIVGSQNSIVLYVATTSTEMYLHYTASAEL